MCLKVSVCICYVSAGNLAPLPPPRPFFIQLLQYTLQRETRVVEWGMGVAWIAAGKTADLQRERDCAVIVMGSSCPLLGLLTSFNRFAWLGTQERDHRHRELRSELQDTCT